MTFGSMQQVRAANARAGQHWFSPGAVAFFDTMIVEPLIDGRFFITTERPPDGQRRATIRAARESGEVLTVGDLCAWESPAAAREALAGARAAGVRLVPEPGGGWRVLLGGLIVGPGFLDAVAAQACAEEIGG